MPDAPKRVDGWEARRARLKARRAEIRSTQEMVAERSGLDQPYVAKIENGWAHASSYETRKKLAKGLRVSLAKLDEILEGP